MKRILLLIGFAFVVLTASSIVGVHLAERGARERRAERFARSVLESIRSDGTRHREALGASELAEVSARAAAFAQGATLVEQRFSEDRWELAYCLQGGEPFQIWVPDPNPGKRARLFFGPSDSAPPCTPEARP